MKKSRSSFGPASTNPSNSTSSSSQRQSSSQPTQPNKAPPPGRLSLRALQNVAKNQRNQDNQGNPNQISTPQPPKLLTEKEIKAAERVEKKSIKPQQAIPQVDKRIQLLTTTHSITAVFDKVSHALDNTLSPYPIIGINLQDLSRLGLIAGDIISLSILLPTATGDQQSLATNTIGQDQPGSMYHTPIKKRIMAPSTPSISSDLNTTPAFICFCQVQTSPAFPPGIIRLCRKFEGLLPVFHWYLQHQYPDHYPLLFKTSPTIDTILSCFKGRMFCVQKSIHGLGTTPSTLYKLSKLSLAPFPLHSLLNVIHPSSSSSSTSSTMTTPPTTIPTPTHTPTTHTQQETPKSSLYTQFTNAMLTALRSQFPFTLTTPFAQSLCGEFACFIPIQYTLADDTAQLTSNSQQSHHIPPHHLDRSVELSCCIPTGRNRVTSNQSIDIKPHVNSSTTSNANANVNASTNHTINIPSHTLYYCDASTHIEIIPSLPLSETNHFLPPFHGSITAPYSRSPSTEDVAILDKETYYDPENPPSSSSSSLSTAAAASSFILRTASIPPTQEHPELSPPKEEDDSDIGGLDHEMKVLKDTLELPLLQPDLFTAFNLKPPRGVLLHGPPGCGKTTLASWLSKTTSASFIQVTASSIIANGGASNIGQLFETALRKAPCIVFIDEIDALCSDHSTVCALLSILDGGYDTIGRSHVCILGATNRVKALPPALRRPGRFDVELHVSTPNIRGRIAILQKKMKRIHHNLSPDAIQQIAESCNGFVGADIDLLLSEAIAHSMVRFYSDDHCGAMIVTVDDLRYALRLVRPSGIRDISNISITESEVGGHEEIKKRLEEAFEWPLRHSQLVERLGARKSSGILLYGPPGCAKTLLAKSVCARSKRTFLCVKGPELFSKYVGDSEKAVRAVFQRARACAPCILFLDEVDSFGSSRGGHDATDRVVSQLLIELDGINDRGDVCVLAATNRPDLVDKALLRSGRLDRALYVGPPDLHDTKEILKLQLSRISIHPSVLDHLDDVASACFAKQFTGAELTAICRDSAVRALTEHIQLVEELKARTEEQGGNTQATGSSDRDEEVWVKPHHVYNAINATESRISPKTIQFYLDYQRNNGLTNL